LVGSKRTDEDRQSFASPFQDKIVYSELQIILANYFEIILLHILQFH